ncbi:hypothetical protein THSYN_03620 [Candidatus Thiodictyon syntrophicum]|jgi:hypothetical protein|uniref:PEP-CTERM protein-sorting domain-containing protein n=2 Tax=Candidatus Thiodictyon syntrophicum TaxID=1166950 RepID=A0A2K8U413_9GAMM|nr:hypothetical protein THSYN_03620 [Candidatus Thiodictyon syntrophicum]
MRLIALTAFGMASAAQANLMIDVYEYGTLGQSRWVFSGSAQYSENVVGGKFAGGDVSLIEEWKGAGAGSDYVKTGAYNNYTPSLISGSVTLSVTPSGGNIIQGLIDGLHIDHDTTTPTSGDDFGVSLAAVDIALSADALVSWSGEAIFNVDINKLNRGTFSFLNYGEDPNVPGRIYGSLPLTLEVPEPGTAVLLMLGVTGLVRFAVRRGTNPKSLLGTVH